MPNRPTPNQLRLLRALALERGQTFAIPSTLAVASREIARLMAQPRSTRSERTLERRQISHDLAASGDAAAPQAGEIAGFGAGCRWAERAETQR
jgi:hypothetical protein